MSLEERWGYVGDDVAANIMLEGLRPIFHTSPPVSLDPPPEALTSPSQVRSLLEFIPDWLNRGIVREVTERIPLFFSRMFTVQKKNGKKRPILDLSCLNKLISTPQFRMETRENSKANNLLHVGDFGGFNRRLPAYSYSSGVPDLLCVSPGTEDLCVSGHAVWSNNSAMGFFQGSETHKVFSASPGSNDLLLSGRLSHPCLVFPFNKDTYQMDIGSSGMAGVHSESREIVSGPSPETGVSGHYVEPSESYSFSPSGEDPFLLSGGSLFLMADQEGVGEAGRLLKFCHEGSLVGKTLFDSPYQLDEQSYFCGGQGLASSSGLRSEGGLWALVKQGVPGAVRSYEHFRSYSRYYVRCIRPWLVWNPPTLASPGSLVRRGAFFTNRLAGAKSYPRYYFPLCGKVEREFGSSSFGQFHGLGLSSSSGFYSLSRAIPAFQGYFRILPFSQYLFDPCPYQEF